jgi:4-amino-4-deoxy-L-arabinose transferase-like glycosyltransferase
MERPLAGAARSIQPAAAAVAAAVAVTLAIGLLNAHSYPPRGGYDAAENIDYARGLVEDGSLPDGTGSYYTPPLFYTLAGLAIQVGERLGLAEPERAAQVLNAVVAAAAVALVGLLARLVFPGRRRVLVLAAAFAALCPVNIRTAAMFHPEPLALLLSTAALVLLAWLVRGRTLSSGRATLLGLALGAAQLVRAWTLVTVTVVLLTLLLVAALDRPRRRETLRALAVVVAVAVAVPAPWYVQQTLRYDNPVFDRPQPDKPLYSRRPLVFYISTAGPRVVTRPWSGSFNDRLLPLAYAETWGDYFGVWRWGPSRGPLDDDTKRGLVVQSVVGLAPTVLAAVGWLALLLLVVRRPREDPLRFVPVLLPAFMLAAIAYFATAYPTPDGDTVKGTYMLVALPGWALAFGFAVDAFWNYRRARLALVAILTVSAFVCARFVLW